MLEEAEWTPPDEFDEYRIVRQLGRGSMGSVYLAQDIVLDRPVAVKFLGALRPDAVERERFLVEARAVARIHHPNVMSIFRVGEVKGRLYLVTEYVRGQNLADLDLPLPWPKVLSIGIGLARALGAAHRQGVLHRDIKLSNAVIEEGVQVKLLDFGLAKLVDTSAERRSRPTGELADAAAAAAAAADADAEEEEEEEEEENAGDLLVRAATNARQMVVQRLADTMKIDTPSTTGPTPKVRSSAEDSLHKTPKADASRHRDRQRLGAWNSRSASITRAGTVMGTPHYMAPELWLADPASRRSDVYGLGVVLFILCAGRPPHDAESPFELAMQVQERDPPPLLDLAPEVDPKLAEVIDRCLARDPYNRFASGDELRAALDALAAPVRSARAAPSGNPYRGLQAFEAEHRSLFFGRSAEVRSVIERLRTSSFVVVAGDSGVGKSSLCRAGVIPAVLEGELAAEKTWRSVTMTPGRFPRQSFVSVIARGFGLTEDEVSELLSQEPELLVRALRKQLGETGGCLIFLDQFEEFVTIAEPSEVEVIGPMIVRLLAGIPGLRVLATVRGDFLTRVVTVPGLGDEVSRGIFLLRPLSPEGAREAVVGPAQVHGVSFESDELVAGLVEAGIKGSLPLLQFALAELWESRDTSASVITEAELRQIGGVTGALARHADGVLANLLPDQRSAARRLLMRLVTLDNTRASLTEDELVANDEASKAALDALVRGRLLVVREAGERMVYEIAHEALVGGWAQLAGWLSDEQEARAVMHRLEQAAAEWERLGKRREGLWSSAQLAEAGALDRGVLRARETAFLGRSEVNASRSRNLRRAAIIALPVLLSLVYVGVRLQSAEAIERRVDAHIQEAREHIEGAVVEKALMEERRRDAITYFDDGEIDVGNRLWAEMLEHSGAAVALYSSASQALETGRSIDAEREDLQAELAAVLYERMLLAEELGQPDIRDELLARLSLYDHDGVFADKWREPARLEVVTSPQGARVSLSTYAEDESGQLRAVASGELGVTPVHAAEIGIGSHLLTVTAEDGEEVRYPLLVRRGETLRVQIDLPPAGRIPPGFVYIPEGRFVFGARGDEDLRKGFYETVPAHDFWTKSYLISKHEATYRDYIEYLETLSDEELEQRRPRAGSAGPEGGLNVLRGEDGVWRFEWQRGNVLTQARAGESFEYSGRKERTTSDWLQWPVGGIAIDDALAYSAWLSHSGRLPGARLCSEIEWERGAVGSGDRIFPHGNVLAASDANFEQTYQRSPLGMGPDPVGSFPISRSPFGLDDMAGNAYEWTTSSLDEGEYVARGGSFFFGSLTLRAVNRAKLDRDFRSPMLGVRICATHSH